MKTIEELEVQIEQLQHAMATMECKSCSGERVLTAFSASRACVLCKCKGVNLWRTVEDKSEGHCGRCIARALRMLEEKQK